MERRPSSTSTPAHISPFGATTAMARKIPFAAPARCSEPTCPVSASPSPTRSRLDGVWFPVTFSTEPLLHVLYFFHRQNDLDAQNRDFKQIRMSPRAFVRSNAGRPAAALKQAEVVRWTLLISSVALRFTLLGQPFIASTKKIFMSNKSYDAPQSLLCYLSRGLPLRYKILLRQQLCKVRRALP